MSSLALWLGSTAAHVTFLVYTAMMLLHLSTQTLLAHLNYRRSRDSRSEAPFGDFWPVVDVIIPAYNENPEDLDACCAAILAQDYPGTIRAHLVDDCSPNRADVMHVYEKYSAVPGWRVVLAERNGGKRVAQDLGFAGCTGDVVVTIDSDTQIQSDGIRTIVGVFRDRRVGAATGDVRVANRSHNLLTLLIDLRYWVAFNQERAAQSFFGSVLCCSGPFAVYRRDVLLRVWPRYVSQTFRGTECTYGDDRHLTNLVLGEGYRTAFEPHATAITSAPTGMRQYLKQQTRWNKSFYRELLWTLTFLPRLAAYMTFEVITQTLLPILLVLAIITTGIRSVSDPVVLLHYAAAVAGLAVLHCLYAMYRTRDWRFLAFVLYGFIHAALLVPIRIKALCTLTDNKWGTRDAAPAAALGGPAVTVLEAAPAPRLVDLPAGPAPVLVPAPRSEQPPAPVEPAVPLPRAATLTVLPVG